MSGFVTVKVSDDDMLGLLEDAQELLTLAECLVSRAEVLATLVCELMDLDEALLHAASEEAQGGLRVFRHELHGTSRRVRDVFGKGGNDSGKG